MNMEHGGTAEVVDRLSVGRLVSVARMQSCKSYTPIDTTRLEGNLRTLRMQKSVGFTREDMRHFWKKVRRKIHKAKQKTSERQVRRRSRSRSRRRRSGRRGRRGCVNSDGMFTTSDSSSSSDKEKEGQNQEVELFIVSNCIDEVAAGFLRKCSPDVQAHVMSRSLADCKNPSSALMRRIIDIKKFISESVPHKKG